MNIFSKRIETGFILFFLAVLLPAAEAGGPGKVEVCHFGNVITVGVAAQAAHFAHGDPEEFSVDETGACEEDSLPD